MRQFIFVYCTRVCRSHFHSPSVSSFYLHEEVSTDFFFCLISQIPITCCLNSAFSCSSLVIFSSSFANFASNSCFVVIALYRLISSSSIASFASSSCFAVIASSSLDWRRLDANLSAPSTTYETTPELIKYCRLINCQNKKSVLSMCFYARHVVLTYGPALQLDSYHEEVRRR